MSWMERLKKRKKTAYFEKNMSYQKFFLSFSLALLKSWNVLQKSRPKWGHGLKRGESGLNREMMIVILKYLGESKIIIKNLTHSAERNENIVVSHTLAKLSIISGTTASSGSRSMDVKSSVAMNDHICDKYSLPEDMRRLCNFMRYFMNTTSRNQYFHQLNFLLISSFTWKSFNLKM